MSLNTQLSNLSVNTEANALAALLNSGFIDVMDGAQPLTADTALSGQNVLATLTLSATAFVGASAGVLTANAITAGVAGNTGTATWFRAYQSNYTTVVMDGTVGVIINQSNLVLSTTAITSGTTVTCSSFQHTVAKATAGF